ncbi:HNH endonuclease signature motif containing protein [Georgenia sp. SYP-B2076]|uniref:HNH endonuclease signature motif containing protein n=1 Tax=Georgenia sp. SYP-B2076 TaxID=2495881 RepID=UPI0013E0461C|nr:HNH endonuclease signature motif containing protein [Georgenia sp. SYP-B2076]
MSVLDTVTDPGIAASLGLSDVSETLTALCALDLQALPSQGLLDAVAQLEIITRKVEALTAKALVAAEADGLWATTGARSFGTWYRGTSHRHGASAHRQVKAGRALRDHLPLTAEALADAQVTGDHVAALVKHATDTPARRAQLTDHALGEAFLLSHAVVMDAEAFTHLVKHWATRTDPSAADRAWKDEAVREELVLAKTTGGYHVQGWLSQINGDLVAMAIDARVGVPAADDHRSVGQRRAAGLTSLAHLVLDSGVLKPGARIRPHVTITADIGTLLATVAAQAGGADALPPGSGAVPGVLGCARHQGAECTLATINTALNYRSLTGVAPATAEDGTPIPFGLFARLLCQSQIHRVVFGADSEVLDAGREERLFTVAQTRAIIARDKTCQYPGCHAPPGEGEIHHSVWWYAQNGTTDLLNGLLLCWYHHDDVHLHSITIERYAHRWRFIRPDGHQIGETLAA